MQVAIIGLGRMGKNIALHLLEQGVSVVVYNRSRDDIDELVAQGASGAYSLAEIRHKWAIAPIVCILFVPAGKVIDEMLFGDSSRHPELVSGSNTFEMPKQVRHDNINGLINILPPGSIIIDGGNSFYQDSQRRYKKLKAQGIHFLDMGTSGGLEGARNGACLMVGGDEDVYKQVESLLAKIACQDGYGYFGPSGAGHYVKMVHNAIEYGMMGSIGEGFNLITNYELRITNQGKSDQDTSDGGRLNPPASGEAMTPPRWSNQEFKIDLAKLAKVWSHGSIVSGLLMNKAAAAFSKNGELSDIAGEVPRGETEAEMEWLETTGTPHPVIIEARKERVATRTKPSFIGKVIAAMRREFGGHAVKGK